MACTFASAQVGGSILDTYRPHSGIDLTMEEAIYKGAGYDRSAFQWLDAGRFVYMLEPGKALQGSVDSETVGPYKPQPFGEEEEFNAAGCAIRLEGNSLFGRYNVSWTFPS